MMIMMTMSFNDLTGAGDSRLDYAKMTVRSAVKIFASGKTEKALGLFKKAAAFVPEEPEYQSHVGVVLIALGRLDEAQEVFSAVIDNGRVADSVTRSSLYYHRGLCRNLMGDLPGALEDSRQASELNPASANVWRQLGLCHFQLADFRSALNNFEESLRYEPESPFSLYQGALAHFKLGNWRESLEMMDRAIKFAAPCDQPGFRKAREALLGVFDPPQPEESVLRPKRFR